MKTWLVAVASAAVVLAGCNSGHAKKEPSGVEAGALLLQLPAGWTYAAGVARPAAVPPEHVCELRFMGTEGASKLDAWFDGAWRSFLALHHDVEPLPRLSPPSTAGEVRIVGGSMKDAAGNEVHALFLAIVKDARAQPMLYLSDDPTLFEAHRVDVLAIIEHAAFRSGEVPRASTALSAGGWNDAAALRRK